MIIKYNDKLDTSIKYKPLIFHLWLIENSLILKIETQDDELRGYCPIATIQLDGITMDVGSLSCCEIAYRDFYILGDKQYDNDVFSFNFNDKEELLTYVETIVNIFDNINIFDTTIYVHEINVETNAINTKIYEKTGSTNIAKRAVSLINEHIEK